MNNFWNLYECVTRTAPSQMNWFIFYQKPFPYPQKKMIAKVYLSINSIRTQRIHCSVNQFSIFYKKIN